MMDMSTPDFTTEAARLSSKSRSMSMRRTISGRIEMADRKNEGKGDQVKGRVQEAVGKVTGKRSTEWKGKAARAKGKLKEKLG
jgi:uncharacterized protein YjbJ (UPF0337 family)